MNAPWNASISDRFSSLCARVFSPAAAILESEKTLGTGWVFSRIIRRELPYTFLNEDDQVNQERCATRTLT